MSEAPAASLPVGRRIRRQVIRQQARLEAGTGDRWIPAAVTIVLAFLLSRSALARLTSFDTGLDLAAYSQSLWLLSEAKMPQASLLGTDVHLLELNWSFILYPLALLAIVAPPAELLLVVQAVALASVVPPLWFLARRVANLRVGAAAAVIAAYAVHPATHRLAVDDFHPVSLAIPALVAMAYFGAVKQWIPYWLAVAVALACRADIGLAVALWGFVMLGNRERTVGIWTLGVGLLWSLGLLMVVEPLVGLTGVAPAFGGDGSFFGEMVLAPLGDPIRLVQDLVAERNVSLVVGLLSPVLFLPLLSLRHLAPALPLGALYLVAETTSISPSAYAERAAVLLAFSFIAATFALNRLGNMGVDRVFLDVRVLYSLAAASVLSSVAVSPLSPYQRPWDWSDLTATDRSIEAAVELIGEDTPVRASPAALARLSQREWVFALDQDREPTAAQVGFPDFTRAVLLVDDQLPPTSDGSRDDFDQNMAALGFQLLLSENGVTLYSREEAVTTAPDGSAGSDGGRAGEVESGTGGAGAESGAESGGEGG